jgi:hypothetical protein
MAAASRTRPSDVPLLSRAQLAARLTEAGYPTSKFTLATRAAEGNGPPYRIWGRRAVYPWASALAWAEARLTGPKAPRSAKAQMQPAAE